MTNLFTRFKFTNKDSTVSTKLFSFRLLQEKLFTRLAFVLAVLLTVVLLIFSFSNLGSPNLETIIGTALLWLTVPPKLLPHTVRVYLFILLIAVLGIVSDLLTFGILGIATNSLILLLVVSLVFLDIRFSRALLGISTLVVAVVGGGVAYEFIVLGETARETLLTNSQLLANLFTFTVATIILSIITFAIVQNAQALLARQRIFTQTLTDNRNSLEQRVSERTHALEITAQLNRTLSNVLDPQQLLEQVVDQIQEAFNYYHVHIYLLDHRKANLYIAAGTGEVGKTLLIGKHKIRMGEGIVGLAAETRKSILVTNVFQSKQWLPNTLLPETKSEISIPIIVGDELFGVLDVQHNTVDGLSQQDLNLLTTVANQVAISLRSANIYAQVQERIQHQSTINSLERQIQLAPNITFTLHTAARELRQVLDANRVGITLLPRALGVKSQQMQQEEEV